MKFMMKFKKDPAYMLKYLGSTCMVLLCFNATLLMITDAIPPYQLFILSALLMAPSVLVILFASAAIFALGVSGIYFEFNPVMLWLLPLAVVFAPFTLGSLMHNAAHYNFRPRWLNPIIGELISFHHLIGGGYEIYAISHAIHHKYPDDPDKDPHPPMHLGYWAFVNNMKTTIQRSVHDHYMDNHEDRSGRLLWNLSTVFVPLNRYMKAITLLLLCGPEMFCMFWIPSYVAVVFAVAHFNYVTHRPDGHGGFDIFNKHKGLLFGFINLITCNLYYHKNHHKNCTLIDPKKLGAVDAFSGVAHPVAQAEPAFCESTH